LRTTKNKAQASASALSQKLTEAEAKLIEEAEKRAAKAEQPPPKPVIDLKKVANEPEAQVPRPKTKEVKSKEQGPSAKKRKRGELNIISDESDTSSSSDIDNDEPPVKTTKATKKTPVVATSTKAVSIDALESRLESRLEARLESSLKSFLERLTPAAQPPVAKSPPQPLYQPPPPAVQQRPPIPQNSYPPPSYPSYQPEPHYGEPRCLNCMPVRALQDFRAHTSDMKCMISTYNLHNKLGQMCMSHIWGPQQRTVGSNSSSTSRRRQWPFSHPLL